MRDEIDLLIERSAELTSAKASPGIIVSLAPAHQLAAFILDALQGSFTPYAGSRISFREGPLGRISDPQGLLQLGNADYVKLSGEFQRMLRYVTQQATDSSGTQRFEKTSNEIAATAERLVRRLCAQGWHVAYLHEVFTRTEIRSWMPDLTDAQTFGERLVAYFDSKQGSKFVVYTPRLIGRGGEDWGFKSVTWERLPEGIRRAFAAHLARELRVEPTKASSEHDDEGYGSRFRKWELELESLKLSKFVRAEVEARDPYSAADSFRERYRRLKSVIYVSRKGTGTASAKSLHNTHRNVGRSPVQLQDVSAIMPSGDEALDDERVTLTHLEQPAFPYQKLKNEFSRQRELMGLFFDRCPVFRQLACSYASALEAFANRDVENIFRHLAIATELIFAGDYFDETKSKQLLIREGAVLLAFDWLRDQFQSLTFLTKLRSPSRSEEREPLQIHLIILSDEYWIPYVQKLGISRLHQWRRDRLMTILRSPSQLDTLRTRFEAELTFLWHARHQFAHRANVFRDGYFIALLLNVFRLALDFRLSVYAIWLEWNAGDVIREGPDAPEWGFYEKAFVDGWKNEFKERAGRIWPDFERLQSGRDVRPNTLVLGAGYVGLDVHPKRNAPVRPLSV